MRTVRPRRTGGRGPFRDGAFGSPLHDETLAAWLGVALAVAFGVCFVTGLVSHFMQHPVGWLRFPTHPAWLYRLTQGLHVATGIAAIPLLAAKLWTVYPRLFTWPPVRAGWHALERLALLVLVGGAVFQLVTGLVNVARFYPWGFFFPSTHYAVAWITVGALVVHVGAKLEVTRRAVRAGIRAESPPRRSGLSRRGFLATVGAASGAVTLVTAGQTVRPLAGVALLAPRRPGVGPQGLPVNKYARAAGVVEAARDPAYRLVVAGGAREIALSLAQLRAMAQYEVSLPIACVEGWSAGAHWSGVRVRDLLDAAGVPVGATVRVESLQAHGGYRSSTLGPPHSRDPRTLLALRLDGEALHVDHGYPCRLIAPDRPGALQTKWVGRLTVLT